MTTMTKPRAKRKTFAQVRKEEHAKYEGLMQELADEINALREQLESERATLKTIRKSLYSAVTYRFKGHV
jgi:signal transduction histidine kinase